MSTQPAVTMQELELEHAELLPSRETLSVTSTQPSPSGISALLGVGTPGQDLLNLSSTLSLSSSLLGTLGSVLNLSIF